MGGARAALLVQLGSIAGDVAYALLGLTGAAIVLAAPAAQLALGVAGVAVMGVLGLTGLRSALRTEATLVAATLGFGTGRRLAGRGPFLAGLGLSLLNPWAALFWLGIGGALAAAGLGRAGTPELGAFLGAYVGGVLAYGIVVAGLVGA
ncbi:MAG TPA: LysE family transporter, partial [Candidatus Limnocylindrales bacterium]|nr:LysE family transporter [Candidatus Limnocylindrales bacterium]